MKRYINILLIAVAVIFQAGMYFYLDRVVLVPASDFSQQIITDESKAPINPPNASKDHKYYAKIQTSGVIFFTADNVLIKEIPLQVEDSVSYFSWVTDTHLALIGITSSTSRGTSVTLKPVNLDTNSSPQEPKISGLSRGSKIDAVAFSPQINVTYILVRGNTVSSVYRTDANNRLTKVLTGDSIWRIAAMQSVDMLLYDDKKDSAVYALNHNGTRKLVSPKGGQYTLLGTDKDDNIYIGQLSSPEAISTVLKGTMNGNFTEFQSLNYPYPADSVTIDYDGKLELT